MNIEQLAHAIRAACNVAEDQELYIFGSQAILGEFPDAPEELRKSVEVDVVPVNKPDAVDKIDGALGENSPFHQMHGFYVHGVALETAVLPKGWKERTRVVRDYLDKNNIGYCVEAHDLAASKLIAFREKDTEFVRFLILRQMINPTVLHARIQLTQVDSVVRQRALTWTELIIESLSDDD
ncbi:hypothetical protein CYPRO_0432 [Cyclonatronum proteinivorum]|uniref:DUF6036 domain-containing protein n=1 Tax=Cyclonatronum proteinivorum TaxID=1457365 RepID=A0A345UGW7_9BACT|nr:DUF6036 family nucleotidyltransferase [Cyclonatronum proteinivorum]AXI99718.1 hypothetical protein CYPRO_0432 [Cyclonatronum proteinivorum]